MYFNDVNNLNECTKFNVLNDASDKPVLNKINDSNDLKNLLMSTQTIKRETIVQPKLFHEPDENEKKIIDCFKSKEALHYDHLYHFSQLSNTILAKTLLQLEMNNFIKSLPGKRYRLSNY